LFSEFGDRHNSVGEAVGVAEGDAVTASKRVQRQTCPIYKTALTEQRLKRWMESSATPGEFLGNIGRMFGNWGGLSENSSELGTAIFRSLLRMAGGKNLCTILS
jgi:hypothetical protein